ncbi:MAG: esterase/lipase family protein [Nitrospiria bacterium]
MLKRISILITFMMVTTFPLTAFSDTSTRNSECVILLHGLVRTCSSMEKMASVLRNKGYEVVNQGYASRDEKIATLSELTMPRDIATCERQGTEKTIHFFVSHSMGGILIRDYLSKRQLKNWDELTCSVLRTRKVKPWIN